MLNGEKNWTERKDSGPSVYVSDETNARGACRHYTHSILVVIMVVVVVRTQLKLRDLDIALTYRCTKGKYSGNRVHKPAPP